MTTRRYLLTTGLTCVAIATTTLAGRSTHGGTGASFDRSPIALLSSHADQAQQTPADPNAIVQTYCVKCHNNDLKKGDLSLETFDIVKAAERAELSERMIRKLQAGLMPPPGSRRPDEVTYTMLIRALETTVDSVAAAKPNPGGRTFQRLNRPEYARAIHDLLAIDVDAGSWLPLDQKSANFDNIADEQALSATLLESYLNAASDISRMAVGDRNAPAVDRTYTEPSTASQHPWDHVDGTPFGTRGGMVVDYVFPADAEYVFAVSVTSGDNTRFEDVDVSIDGERVALVRWEVGISPRDADGRGATPLPTEPIFVKAGQHRVAAAFVKRFDGPYEDLIRPHDWSFAGGGSGGVGITTVPHLRDFVIKGPYRATGVSETPSRQKIFTCRPTTRADERACARSIVAHLGAAAYRRALTAREVEGVMEFYDSGAKGGFETGVRTALEAILASPHFIFRLERQPDNVKPGETYRISDVDLASRLSFFLWGEPPDDALLAASSRGQLSTPAGLEREARRMLADPRADALGSRFAAQWLRLQDIDKNHPDPNFYPNFGDNLAADMRQETEMFFNALVREDKSVLDLYRADYTFVNERLARHYGFPGVAGDYFRRVTYPDATRRGVLGQGSILVQTSFANRTSPVLRGKWVMEVLMGTPPPPPPMDGSVPPFDKTAEAKNGRPLTTRERMEMHRANPTCNSCHRFMDPIGLALDNFDVTGKWRERENGQALDTHGDYYDGTPITSPQDLVNALLKRPVPLVRTFAENLMAYALGRRVEYFDQPAIRAITNKAQAQNYKMSSFIIGVVTSDAFRMKRADDVKPSTKNGTRH